VTCLFHHIEMDGRRVLLCSKGQEADFKIGSMDLFLCQTEN